MQALLHDPDACKFDFSNFEPLSLPLDPDIKVCGIIPEKAALFKVATERTLKEKIKINDSDLPYDMTPKNLKKIL